LTTDDWPFLYLKPFVLPVGYIALLLLLLSTSALAIRAAYRGAQTRFDPVMFALGGGFLLLETRGVTALSMLFGTTWVVNAFVFGGILTTVLLANLFVERFAPKRVLPFFAPLMAVLAVLAVLDLGFLNDHPLLIRGMVGGLLIGLPVGFAGVIFSMLLRRSDDPAGALGSNVLGAIVGGCLEYLSMAIGLKALIGLAMILYLFALIRIMKAGSPPSRGNAASGP
jgi:hypothetical protein